MTQVAPAAVRGDRTFTELTSHDGVDPDTDLEEGALGRDRGLFPSGTKAAPTNDRSAERHAQISQPKVELDWVTITGGDRLTRSSG